MAEMMAEIKRIWQTSGYAVPRVLLGYYDSKWYVTSQDHGTVYSFISINGRVFMATSSKCVLTRGSGFDFYLISEPDALQIVSCGKPFTAVDNFALQSIVPLLSAIR